MKATPLLILSYFICCHGYPNGPPPTACEDMTPNHGVPPKSGEPPFRLSTNQNTYYRGERITVTLESVSGTAFMGFFLQARWTNSTRAVGRFYIGQEPDIKHLTCGAGYNNALSHHQRLQKQNITFGWSNIEGHDVYFKATIVEHKNDSWTDIRSELVREVDTPTTLLPPATTAQTSRGSSLAWHHCGFIGLFLVSFVKAIL